MCSHPPSYAHPLPSGRARYGPRPLSLLPHFLSTSRRHRRSQQHRTSPLHSAIGTAPRTRPPPPFCIAVVRDSRALKADRTATMNPVLICFLVVATRLAQDSPRVELFLPHPERAVQSSSLPRRRTGSKLYMTGCMGALLTPPRICGVEGDSGDSRAEARDVRPTHGHSAPPVHQG